MQNAKLPTIRDIARQARVSETTVSLSFREESRISPPTRKRILALARRLKYAPNRQARLLRLGQNKLLGILVNDITNPFYALMVQQAQRLAEAHGYEMLIADSQWQAERETAQIEIMLQSRVAGVLACFCEKTQASRTLLKRFSMPFVALDTCPPGHSGPVVINDLAGAARLAAAHLSEVGCRRPVFFTAQEGMAAFSAFRILRQEFMRAARARGLTFSAKRVLQAGLTVQAGQDAFALMSGTIPDADGIFCANSLCALGVLDAADRAGVRVGRELKLIGVDDLDFCRLGRISLTTIRQPYEKLVERALPELLSAMKDRRRPAARISLQPELIVRHSTVNLERGTVHAEY